MHPLGPHVHLLQRIATSADLSTEANRIAHMLLNVFVANFVRLAMKILQTSTVLHHTLAQIPHTTREGKRVSQCYGTFHHI